MRYVVKGAHRDTGETVTITSRGRPVARLVPIEADRSEWGAAGTSR